jgi:hypothetical protein
MHSLDPVPKTQLPYSDSSLQCDLSRVYEIWRKSRRRHDRFSVYKYLAAVFDLVMVWRKENQAVRRSKRALSLERRIWTGPIEPFAVIITCTTPLATVDVKARSKWAHALMFAADFKPPSETLKQFVRRHGGINACAAALSRLRRTRNKTLKNRDR